MKKKLNNNFVLALLYALFCVLVIVDFILFANILNDGSRNAVWIIKLILFILVTAGGVVTVIFIIRLDKKNKSDKDDAALKSTSVATLKREVIPAEKVIFDPEVRIISGKSAVELVVWGKRLVLAVDGDKGGEPFTEKQTAVLKWLISETPYENDEVKKEVLKFINETYCGWNDEWEESDDLSILPRETFIHTAVVKLDGNDETVALCGECNCDEEHGISIVFKNKKFCGVGSFMDYESADWLEARRTGEQVESNEKYLLIEKSGFADDGGVFEFSSFVGSAADAKNNRIENGVLDLQGNRYAKRLFTVADGKLKKYCDNLTFIETDKELKRMLSGFHMEYDLKDLSYSIKEIAVTKSSYPNEKCKNYKRVLLSVEGKDDSLDIVVLDGEYARLEKFLGFIDGKAL